MKDLVVGSEREAVARLEEHRAALTKYCYRMLGSYAEAEDAVQETMVRAWRNIERFEGRSSLRAWVYRIATNVCLDALTADRRRAVPMDLSESTPGVSPPGTPQDAAVWMGLWPGGDPEAAAATSESVQLAFVVALQHLSPRQRSTLILRDVLAFSAREVAELHGSTIASVNSALQRARTTLAGRREPDGTLEAWPHDSVHRMLAERYATAFSRYDMTELNTLLRIDATL
ncbi:RNA polymerase subunit sigma-70 [Streptomyces sp. NPDC058955]|uniref:RNA polymerase subunit sigma-70 n=1 Tax=unclassified Streptomyces TaxID=2593676 RepID=UPI00365E2280